MIYTGIFPSRLKFAEIKPLHKKGDLANISNYRPISLLTSFSKVFKKIIFTRLLCHLDYYHILADEQFGFRTNSSMDFASYKHINDTLTSLNNKLLAEGIFCDLQKAFDCVDHELLLSKMYRRNSISSLNMPWVSPDNITENQIDHIAISKRFRRSLLERRS